MTLLDDKIAEMLTTNSNTISVGKDAYNKFSQFSELGYTCIKYIMTNNELIWKLLKYTDSEAWNKADLTQEEKAKLIYSGQANTSDYNVFLDSKQPDVLTKEVTMLRIAPYFAAGINRTVGYIEVSFEIFSHYKINHLSNYKTRIDVITQQLLELFNGADVGGIGLMSFDKMADQSSRLFTVGQIPFAGKQLIFSTLSA